MKKLALIAALSVVGIANAQAADGTITINGLVTDKTCDIVTPAGKGAKLNLKKQVNVLPHLLVQLLK